MVPEYSKEVHAVKKVRFEIKLSTYRDGRTLARIYDDYWDSISVQILSKRLQNAPMSLALFSSPVITL